MYTKVELNKFSWFVAFIATFFLLSSPVFAQDQSSKYRYDFGANIFGQFSNSVTGNGIRQSQTYSPGVLASFRQSNRWYLGYEVNYGYYLSSELYSGQHVQHDTHEATAAYLVQFHKMWGVQPFALVGGGALIFNPTDSPLSHQERPVILYGFGANYMPHGYQHFGLRLQYRGQVYRAPNFDQASLSSRSNRNAFLPTAGFFYRW
jgi:hypothetical protein